MKTNLKRLCVPARLFVIPAWLFVIPVWLLVIFVAPCRSLLGQVCDSCGPCPAPCPPDDCKPVECKVWVPKMVTEYQAKTITHYRPEIRQRMVAVSRNVPAIETTEEEYTVMVPQTRTRTVAETINHPVYGDIQLRTTTATPRVESRQATRTVTRLAAFEEERTVDESPVRCVTCGLTSSSTSPLDRSSAGNPDRNAPPEPPPSAPASEAVVSGGACDTGCSECPPQKVRVTCWKPVCQQETVEYPVTRFQPNAQLQTVSFYEFQPETKFHEEPYVVEVPEKRTRPREITVMREVVEQRPERYTVMVPYQEQIQVPVVTCRWVEQTVAP